jgi:glyoxylase-like metal-dependent hydrolase (beta-lactamase superfamily II)
MELAPKLHRLGTSSLINSYVIDDGGQLTIVDAGLVGMWKDLLSELTAMGRSLSDVKALLLTHGDTDHVGFAERLRREAGVPVFVGAADAAEARGEVPKPAAPRDPLKIGPLVGFMVYGLRHGGLRRKPVQEVRPIEGSTTLDVPGAPVVIPMPGHTPGSVAYHVPAIDAIFMGDAMTTRSVLTGAVGPAPAPFTVNREQAARSLDALEGVDATWVLPGHGDAWWTGLPEALRLIKEGRQAA